MALQLCMRESSESRVRYGQIVSASVSCLAALSLINALDFLVLGQKDTSTEVPV